MESQEKQASRPKQTHNKFDENREQRANGERVNSQENVAEVQALDYATPAKPTSNLTSATNLCLYGPRFINLTRRVKPESRLLPQGTTMLPGGSIFLPNSRIILASGRILLPNGRILLPDHRATIENAMSTISSDTPEASRAFQMSRGPLIPSTPNETSNKRTDDIMELLSQTPASINPYETPKKSAQCENVTKPKTTTSSTS